MIKYNWLIILNDEYETVLTIILFPRIKFDKTNVLITSLHITYA